jgi:hypothetical protein
LNAAWRWGCELARRRWRSVIVLSLLFALACGVAMAAVMGARRSTEVVAETLREHRQPDVISLPAREGFDWSRIVALPYVTAHGFFATGAFCVDETGGLTTPGALCTLPPAGGGMYDTIMRIDAVEGRVPRGPREIAINRVAQERYGWRVGQRLHVSGVGSGLLEAYWNRPGGSSRVWGPSIEVTVVGVFAGDDAWRVISGGIGQQGIAMSTSFLPTFGDRFDYRVDAFLRLRGGAADLPRLAGDVARITGDDTIPLTAVRDAQLRVERSTTVEAVALLLFAVVLLVATVVIVGQALARLVRAGAGDVPALRAMGMSPPTLVAGLAVPGLMVAVVAAVGAVGLAVVLSPQVPIGMARTFDLHPGIKLDLPVIGVGGLGLAVFVSCAALAAALLVVRPPLVRPAPRAPGVVSRLSLPVPARLGMSYALDRRSGSGRSAVVGVVAGVLMVSAAWTVQAGVEDAVAHPERGGQTWDLQFDAGLKDEVIIADPDVAAATELYRTVVPMAGQVVPAYATRSIGTPVDLVVLDGRLPRADDEVAAGPATAARFGLDVGERVRVGRDGRLVRVVGTLFLLEYGGHNAYDEGLLATPAGLAALRPADSGLVFILIDVRDGADPAVAKRRLVGAGGIERSWLPPAGVDMLQRIRDLPVLVGGLLAVLGLATAGLAVVSSARRRRRELAVLRTLGLTGRQVRAVVLWQASTLAAVGVLVGVPFGVLVGRLVWRWIATSMPLVPVTPLAWLAIVLTVSAAIAAMVAMAFWPAHTAARASPAQALRAE